MVSSSLSQDPAVIGMLFQIIQVYERVHIAKQNLQLVF